MSEGEQQPIQPKPDFLKSAAPWADTFSKVVAGIVIALYASGFLTVSVYHSQFGFVSTNPFRPRVLAAGAWFFFLTAIPVSIALSFRLDTWRKIGKNTVNILVGCYTLSILLGSMVFNYTTSSSFIHLPNWGWIAITVVWLSVIVVEAFPGPPGSFRFPDWLVITAAILFTALYVVNPLNSFFKHEFDISCLTLWYFGISLVVLIEFKTKKSRKPWFFRRMGEADCRAALHIADILPICLSTLESVIRRRNTCERHSLLLERIFA